MMRRLLGLCAGATSLVACTASAHEFRPAYLDLLEERPGFYSALWKTPMLGDAQLALKPEFSGGTSSNSDIATRVRSGAAIQEWTMRTSALRGQTLHIRGLEGTMTDVFVRISFADGTAWTGHLSAREPASEIPLLPSRWKIVRTQVLQGFAQTLFVPERGLFMLAILLLARGTRQRVAATLALVASLFAADLWGVGGWSRPVAAVNALGVACITAEVVRSGRGEPGPASRAPWVVAMLLGIPQGLGLSSSMDRGGLPDWDLPLAVVSVCASLVVAVGFAFSLFVVPLQLKWVSADRVRLVLAYAIGILSASWMAHRIASVVTGG